MIFKKFLIAIFAVGLAGPAFARDGVVGGAVAQVSGSGDNAQIEISEVNTVQPPRLATVGRVQSNGRFEVQYL